MKNYVICALIGFFGMFLFLVIKNSGDSDSNNSDYPISYFYNSESLEGVVKHIYVLNKDKTAKIIYDYSWSKPQRIYDTYWQYGSDDSYWIKSDLYGFEVIKEGVLYMSPDDSKSKRNGTQLIKQD